MGNRRRTGLSRVVMIVVLLAVSVLLAPAASAIQIGPILTGSGTISN